MNDRIKQLKEQATQCRPHGHNGVKWVFNPEVFAELIVRECAEIATMNQHQWASAGSYVLKNFGVEE